MKIVRRFLVGDSKNIVVTRAALVKRGRIILAAFLTIAAGSSLGAAYSLKSEELSPTDRASIQEVYEEKNYRPVRSQGGGWTASNPRHGFEAHFGADGSTTLESTYPARPFSIAMRLASVGYGEGMTLNDPPQRIESNRSGVEFAWTETLREWWKNSPVGLEQWFEVSEPPGVQTGDQPLQLGFTLKTSLEASIEDNALVLSAADPGLKVRYTRLKVWDSTGRILPARMELNGHILSLNVEDYGAIYPVTIDPTFEQIAYVKASNTRAFENFGETVAVSGDTVIVAAPSEDSAAN